jgi:regulator of replication initiation timing
VKEVFQEFQARVKAQHAVPFAVEKIAEENRVLKEENARLKAALAAERERSRTLAKVAAELFLELGQAKDELTQATSVTQLPHHRPGNNR